MQLRAWLIYSRGVFRTGGLWCLGLTVAAVFAFWPSYLSLPLAPFDAYTHVHAVAMAMWCALLIAQPTLVWLGRRSWHRTVGKLSYVVAPLVVASTAAVIAHRMAIEVTPFFYLPISFCALFAISFALAIYHRREVRLHAAFMLATALTFIDPIGSRLLAFYAPSVPGDYYPVITFATIDVLLAMIVYRVRGRTLALAAVFVVVELGWFVIAYA
jgi:hypothetical protein